MENVIVKLKKFYRRNMNKALKILDRKLFKLAFCFIILCIFVSFLQAKVKAVWVPIWDIASPEKIDELVADAKKNKINQILLQVRYRGDALYQPNREDKTYPNLEKKSYVLKDSEFDPLEYLIQRTEKTKIEVYAWITVFIATPHDLGKLQPDHIFFTHPEWITADFTGQKMPNDILEGAYLEPGIPQVQNYLFNIIMDIVINYDIDGIHLDYIRYPDMQFGYNEIARDKFKAEVQNQNAESWKNWKEEQINNFLKEISFEIKLTSPQTKITAAVMPNPDIAKNRYSQNWIKWLKKGYVDAVYLMAYTQSDSFLAELLENAAEQRMNKKIIVGLKAWSDNGKYSAAQINDKIKIVKKKRFAGVALFSYLGIKQNNYFKDLKIK